MTDISGLPDAIRENYPVALLAVALGLLFLFGANSLFRKVTAKIRLSLKESTLPFEILLWPFRLLSLALFSLFLFDTVPVKFAYTGAVQHALTVFSIAGLVWFLMRLKSVFEQFLLQHYPEMSRESESGRKNATYVSLAGKILNVLLVMVGVSGILMTFETVRQVGLSILASAGIAGVILGFAAQKSLATLISGIQIAVTQPISIDDEVVVENESGKIEEITLTYAVVRLWDQRRLIVPVAWFLEKPFQNWTRKSPELLGTVYLSIDYSVPIDDLRNELERIVSSTPLWDRRAVRLHVTGTTDRSVEVRALVSAANSADMWELRCHVREQLLEFIRERFPGGLPKVRMEMDRPGSFSPDGDAQ
ncbi:MAG: mechanosensitive ion channel [Chlorobiaceae bacterium]|nr:mechanosensitive ion channel [Chlorobiaceae bacterium]